MFYLGARGCTDLAANFSLGACKSCVLRGFSPWGLTRDLQKPNFVKVPKTRIKQHFRSQIAVLLKRQKCTTPPAVSPPGAFQIMSFTRFQLLGPRREPTKAQFFPRSAPPPPLYRFLGPSKSCVLRGFSSWGLTGGLQKPSFAKVPKTLVKPHF